MKKLITIILILALLLPAAALADDPYIEKHYVLQLERVGTKIDSSLFNFDTIAIDLLLMADGETAYYMETRCYGGLFLSNGMIKMRVEEYKGETYLVDAVGNYRMIRLNEETDEAEIDFGYGYYQMTLIEPIYIYQ